VSDGLGNHAPGWEPSANDVPLDAPGLADFAEAGKVEGLRPSQTDMRAAFGAPVDEGKSVRWSLDMRDPNARSKYKELTAPHRRATIERSHKYNARKKVEIRSRVTGEKRLVFEEFEDVIGRKNGMARSLLGRGCRVARGPDGMLFRLVGGEWMATGRTCLGTPLDPQDSGLATGVQRDPDGGSWLCIEGEWEPVAALLEREGA
jgi:hypothetical protein